MKTLEALEAGSHRWEMLGGIQEPLPFEMTTPKRQKPRSMWEKIGHKAHEWADFNRQACESQAGRVRHKRSTKLTPSYLSKHPDFDHTGPPPPDHRCECGSGLTASHECKNGYKRIGGKWQCPSCFSGVCSWPECSGAAHFNRADGKGKECKKHHCGYCSTPGCDAWAGSHIRDGEYVCTPCSRGKCECGKRAVCVVDGVGKCRQCGNVVCTEPGCGSLGNLLDGDGNLKCKRHMYGTCQIDGCETPADSSHGRCGDHAAKGDDWVARATVREGHGYLYVYEIHHASNGRLAGVGYGHTHHTRVRNTFQEYDRNLPDAGLRRGKTLLLELPDVAMAKSDDTKVKQFIPGRTLEQKTGKKVKRLRTESNCDVAMFDLVQIADANEHINVKMFIQSNEDDWACKWLTLTDDYALAYYGSSVLVA